MTHSIIDTINALPVPTEPMDELIALAQLGDRDAALKVLRAHMNIIVSEVTRSVRLASQFVEGPGFSTRQVDWREDVIADAFQVFFRVLATYDPDRSKTGRFGSLLYAALRRDERMTSAVNRTRNFRIPDAVAIRRGRAIKAADGDIEKARELVGQFGISKETFDAVTRAYDSGLSINNEDSPAALFGHRESGYVRIDHLHDTERALSALDFTSRMIVESAFGLNGQPQQSNAEIGASLGLSRWAVQRRLDAAMLTMQEALDDNKETQQ